MSLFTMDQIDQISRLQLIVAKDEASKIVRENKKATVMVKNKAVRHIVQAKTITSLCLTMSNYILAKEGLKVI
jgi:HJR/Mrr/RecB family endonuclease